MVTASYLALGPPKRTLDVRVLGARALPTRALVRLVAGPRADDADVDEAVTAIGLAHDARDAALLRSPIGPRVLAAVELGRRAACVPSPAAARILSPTDVVSAIGPRLVERRAVVVGLDVRMRIARVAELDSIDDDTGSADVLQLTLAASCRRFIVVARREGPATPTAADVDRFSAVRARAGLVGVVAVDHVVVGDDGIASLVRLGLAAPREPRYR